MQNKSDTLKQFLTLRTALVAEKSALEKRIAEIREVIGETPPAVQHVPTKLQPARVENTMSLREAITRVTQGKSLNKNQILVEIDKLGYKFAAADPMNSLNVALYTPGNFKNNGDGTFKALKKPQPLKK